MKANKQTPFIIYVRPSFAEDLSFNILNSVTDERLTFQYVGSAWYIGRLPQNCQESPKEMFDNIVASLRPFHFVLIDLTVVNFKYYSK